MERFLAAGQWRQGCRPLSIGAPVLAAPEDISQKNISTNRRGDLSCGTGDGGATGEGFLEGGRTAAAAHLPAGEGGERATSSYIHEGGVQATLFKKKHSQI